MKEKRANRNYKDNIFRMIFTEKNAALSLFNAVNETDYTETDDVIINTLTQGVFLECKNDLSFIFMDMVNMYEHQSTYTPNMPLRYLDYANNIYEEYVLKRNQSVFASSKIHIPQPKFVVFYMGLQEMPEKFESRLSDLYIVKTDDPALELTVVTLNINSGYNEELKKRCPLLDEYSRFVEIVRKYYKDTKDKDKALMLAVNKCIQNDILKEFFVEHGGGEMSMSIAELSEEELGWVLRDERALGHELGKEMGEKKSKIKIIKNMLDKNYSISEISDVTGESAEYIRNVRDGK